MINALKKLDLKEILTKRWVLAILALISCFLWGSAFPSIKKGYQIFGISNSDAYGQILFAGIRFIISGLMVFGISLIFKYSLKVNKKQLFCLIGLGLLQTAMQYLFFYLGMSNVSGTRGSILSSLGTFFSVIIAPFFFKAERLTLKKYLGVIIGFVGVIILNYQGIASGTIHLNGEGFIVISSLFSAFANIYIKKLTGLNISSFAIAGYQLFIGGIILSFCGLIGSGGQILHFSFGGSLLILYMGFISAAAFSIWTVLLKYNGVSNVSIYKFSIPLFGTALSVFVLNENDIQLSAVVAAIMVVIGILLINKK